jgi:1-acyl-sn-glycerol-3-phosphate acyltransferase
MNRFMHAQTQGYTIGDYFRSICSIPLFFLLLAFYTPVILLLLIVTFGRASNFIVEKIAPAIARPVLFVAGVRFKISKHADPIPSPAVYIINHSSTLDVLTLLAMGLPRIRFVAKWQFQYNPLFFIVGRLTGQVFIRREKSEKAIQTLQKNVTRIQKQQLSLMMAPEGTRKHEGVIGPFKKGPFRMATELQYPIVPIYFEGNRKLSSGSFMITKKGTCTAHIFDAIPTDNWDKNELQQHIDYIRQQYLHWAEMEEKGVL